MKRFWLDVGSSAVLGLGLVLVAMPFFVNWLIHGDYDRYIWLINGPKPFDSWGGGPYQLWLHVSFFLWGLGMVALGLLFRARLLERRRGRPILEVVAAMIAALFAVSAISLLVT